MISSDDTSPNVDRCIILLPVSMLSIQVFPGSMEYPRPDLGPRPRVKAMLAAGVPRCWILVLFMLAYMVNVVPWSGT